MKNSSPATATFKVTVTTPDDSFSFVARIHAHSSSRTFFLHPRKFYKKHGRKIPRKHHELEILEPPREILERDPLHIVKSDRAENWFVCFPSQMRTMETAMEIFRVWCARAVLTWKHKLDLNTVHANECDGKSEQFLDLLVSRYGIIAHHVNRIG